MFVLFSAKQKNHSEVNFTNILQAAFAPKFFCQKIKKATLRKKLLYEKATHISW